MSKITTTFVPAFSLFFVLLYLSFLLLIGNEFESSEFWLLTCELKLKTTAFAPLNLLLNKTNRYFTYKDSDLNSCKFYKYQIIFWKKIIQKKEREEKDKAWPTRGEGHGIGHVQSMLWVPPFWQKW